MEGSRITFHPMLGGFGPLAGHHRGLLADPVRTEAMLAAVAANVREGDVVADVGTGTGVLAIAARRAGARVVYAIEATGVIGLAEQLARDNGVDGIVWLRGRAEKVALPEQVDVVISECMGPAGVGGTMVPAVIGFATRWLRPGGRVVPRRIAVAVSAVEAPWAHAWVGAAGGRRYGIDWAAAQRLLWNNAYTADVEAEELVTGGGEVHAVVLGERDAAALAWAGEVQQEARRDGIVHGIAAWFRAALSADPEVAIDTAPGCPPTVWRQMYLPFERPMPVVRGELVRVGLGVAPSAQAAHGTYLSWWAVRGEERREQSTRWSFPSWTASA
jgi:precorrin-6B methylase 2